MPSSSVSRSTLRRRVAVVSAISTCGVFLATAAVAGETAQRHVLRNPIGPAQQTRLGFGERSHWLQPWRGYLQTIPARRLLNGLGVNFNPAPGQENVVAKELAAAGFRRARIEVGWCNVSYSQPEQLTDLGRLRATLLALRRNHLRPLVLLNAHHGCPGPLRRVRIHVVAPAHVGDRQLTLDSQSISQVVPGHTGLDSTTEYKAAAFLFTGVQGTTVTLSKPLDRSLPAGSYWASTLRYLPFGEPGSGEFEQTMTGWLRYVGLVTHAVKSILGSESFDVEVWNELTFGSDFLDINTYYEPPIVRDQEAVTQEQILGRTLSYIRDKANGVARIGVGDGFSNERPWESGANVPRGLTAIDKHPYPPHRTFPRDAVFNGIRPLDALGRPDGRQDANGDWHDSFIPHYTAFFPEYYLSGIQTETSIRDLSPITTSVYGTPHGRFTHPAGSRPPAIWLTEAGMDPTGIPANVLPRLHAKEALRWITAWTNKGAAAVYLYAVASPGYGLVNAAAPGGGQVLRVLTRLTRAFTSGARPITRPRALKLVSVSDTHDHFQFAGDGTPAHPPLYDRDVVAFFPFQVSNGRIVVATYVMTRDLMHTYRPRLAGSDPRRYDMPPEWFRLTIAGTGGLGRSLSVTDPLQNRNTSVRVVSRRRNRLVIDIALTDSPRLLVIS